MKSKKLTLKLKKNSPTKEFICPKCGYEAYKMARLSSCPLCLICKSCGKTVRKCSCIEGE